MVVSNFSSKTSPLIYELFVWRKMYEIPSQERSATWTHKRTSCEIVEYQRRPGDIWSQSRSIFEFILGEE
jgi:hypothetical protein